MGNCLTCFKLNNNNDVTIDSRHISDKINQDNRFGK